jgi:threonyl-tRNA synthetase
VEAVVLPIADRHVAYAAGVRQRLTGAGFRAQVDERQEKIGYKIREAQLQKIPYMLVVGDREAAEGTVAVRSRSGGDHGSQPLDAFMASAREEVDRKGSQPVLTAES